LRWDGTEIMSWAKGGRLCACLAPKVNVKVAYQVLVAAARVCERAPGAVRSEDVFTKQLQQPCY